MKEQLSATTVRSQDKTRALPQDKNIKQLENQVLELTVRNQDLMRRLSMQRQSKDMSHFVAFPESSLSCDSVQSMGRKPGTKI